MECWKSSVEIGLLEDAGISPQDVYKKIVSKCIKLLQDSTTVEQIPHNHLLGYLRMLAQYTASSKLNITSIYQSVVDGIIGPYLQIIQRSTETQIQILSPCTTAIQNLLSLLSSDGVAQVCVVQYLSSLFKSVGNSLSAPSEETNFNAQFVLTFVSEIFQKISVECLEKGGSDFSCVFEQALGVLKLSDAKMCFVLASSILPRFITSLHTHRAEKIWSLVEAVYLGRVNVEQIQLEFILTILCCFRDVFVQHDKSSPFSNPFVHSVLSLSPLVDIRVKSTFWRVIQEGLVSANPFSRKRCMYLVNCVLLSALDCKTSDICSEGQVFWWAAENTKQLKSVWDDLILVLETMEEKQVHIVKPVKKHLQSVLDASRQQINDRHVLHMSWVHVVLSRVFDHHEAKSIIQWGVSECLGMELTNSPILYPENWSFVCGKLLQVLGQTFLYNRSQTSPQDCYPPLAKELTTFLQTFVSKMEKEQAGPFLAQFLSSFADLKLAEVPLVFISYAVSELHSEPLIGREGLAAIRSIVLSSILTHKPSLREATQSFLLKAVCELTNHREVGYLEAVQTLGSFRQAECLVFGSKSWKQASKFLVSLATLKETSAEESGSKNLFSYLQSCIHAYLQVTSHRDDPLPTISSLARALVLSVDEECIVGSRALSTESRSLGDSLTLLMAPVMDIIATATARAYLAADVVSNALEFLSSLVHLLPSSPHSDTAQVFYKCLSPWLPDTMLYLHTQLLQGAKVGGAPNLDLNVFLVHTLDGLYSFTVALKFPFSENPDISLANLAIRAGKRLNSICSKQDVIEVTPALLGSITVLGWLSSVSPPSPPSLSRTLSNTLNALPLPLNLSRPAPPTCTSNHGDSDTAILGVGGLMAYGAPVEWGPLISQCLSSYWRCLLYMMRESSDWVVEKGVDKLVTICLDGLDSASDSLPTIIGCLSLLVNKSASGPSHLCSFTERVWSLVGELRNKPKEFDEALEAFAQLVFHPNLLGCHNEEVNKLQEQCVDAFFSLGESKIGVFNILVDYTCSIWRKSLQPISAKKGCTHKAELVASLQAHIQLILQACTFGTVHRKNLRIVGDTEGFLGSLGLNMSEHEGSRGDCCVRIKILVFLLEIFGCLSECSDGNELDDFLHIFLSTITSEILKMSVNFPKYYINSHTHRVKLRLIQVLILSVKFANKITCKMVAERLVGALQHDNQRSVRYLMEWTVSLIFTRFPDLIPSILLPCLNADSDGRLSRLCSFLTISVHIGVNLSTNLLKSNYYHGMIPVVLKWVSSHHFTVRMYSQQALYRIWDDCRRSKVTTVLETFCILEESILSMQDHGDCGKFAHKLKENIFFAFVDTLSDLNLQTIFYTLPLLCDAPREDLIPAEHFLSEAKDSRKLQYKVHCKNHELLEASCTYLNVATCGSDTKSISYQLQPKHPSSELQPSSTSGSDIQKKITPWSNPTTVVNELFPNSLSGLSLAGQQDKGDISGLILVTTLLSKVPNIGGLCRTCEIFGVSELVIDNAKILGDVLFQSLSVTSDKWITITEVRLNALKKYLLTMQNNGYTLVGAEQTAQSKPLTEYSFKRKTVLLLGNEREGIPVDLIHLLDDCVEIPQLGVVRSLNVHVSGALLVWEYAKQHSMQPS